MEEFYDRTLANTLNKYANRYKGKVGDTIIPAGSDKQPAKVIEITPEMKKSLLTGQPMKEGGYVEDVIGLVDDYFNSQSKDFRGGGYVAMKEGGTPETKQELRAVKPAPIIGEISEGLGKASEFLKSRPLKEEGSWQAKGAASAINSTLELVDSFFVNDLAKTAERMSYGDRLTSGSGQTLQILPETIGAALTVAPPAAKLAAKTAKVVRKVAPEVAETAAQMAERYAMQPMYAVPPGKRMSKAEAEAAGLWHPISDVKLRRPYQEMTATTIDNPAVIMPQRKIITPEDLYKKAGFPKIGDRAATGKILTHINDQKLAWDVPLTGGPEYSMANLSPKPGKSAAWESGQGKVTALQNRIEQAAESADDVVGVYSSGSLQQVDFNTMMSDALAAQLSGTKLTKKAKTTFDKDVRKFYPEFVGVDSPKLREQLLDKKNGVLRTAFVKRMNNAEFQNMGFPDVPATRKAISEASIMEDPIGTTGFTMAKMDTGRRTVDPKHPSGYPIAMAGEYIGGLETRIPFDVMFNTQTKQRRLLGAPTSGDYRSYELAQPVQAFDQEWLDTVSKYLEQQKKLTGKKKGGVVEDDGPPLPPSTGKPLTEEEIADWQRKSKAYENRQYWKRRGQNSPDENDTPGRLDGRNDSYPMRSKIPQQRDRQMMPEVRDEEIPFKRALRYYQKGGRAKGAKITEKYSIAPEAKTPKMSKSEEGEFQKGVRGTKWFQQFVDKYGEPPDLNSKDYNYRAAWKAGVRPQDYEHDPEMQHWASTTGKGESLKSTSHPTAWMEDYMQVTGSDPHKPVDMNPEQVKAMQRALMYRYGK
jgi:hypothetical protein